jgi:hypothetical protein
MPPHGDPHPPGDVPAPPAAAEAGDALALMLPLVHTELRAAAPASSGAKGRATPCNPPSWCTRPGCGWPARHRRASRAGSTSWASPPGSCARCWSITRGGGLALKRGGGVRAVTLEQAGAAATLAPEELLGLDEALERLGRQSPRLRQVVEYRFFAGLEEEEIAQVLGVTRPHVQRDWARARAWLHQALAPEGAAGGR